MLDKKIAARYDAWCNANWLDEADRERLLAIKDEAEINDCFYCDLEFGTGGMRGELGLGTNRMSIYLIRRLTKALADEVIAQGGAQRGVAISYDSRRFSPEFAREAAMVLAANGVKAYLFPKLHPTPMLSYAVRELLAMAGIMITASHNPKQYNGYKVYWEDGGQLPPEQADKIVARMEQNDSWDIAVADYEEAISNGLIELISEELDATYCEEVLRQLPDLNLTKNKGDSLKIVYSALSGTGHKPVPAALQATGFTSLWEVAEQALPDAEFATLAVPNPEDEGAWELSRALAAKLAGEGEQIDLLLATDPDADRLGVCCRNHLGEFVRLSGNQVGVLLADYLLKARAVAENLPEGAIVVKSVVSTAMADKVVAARGAELINVPVGFKFIGEQIKLLEDKGEEERFIFGFEESLGYLSGTYARDKDAVLAAVLVAGAALYYNEQGKSLLDVLDELYGEVGYYLDEQVALTLSGQDGKERIAEIMRRLRNDERESLGKMSVISREFYAEGKQSIGGEIRELGFAPSNMIGLSLSGGKIAARPSGTEPKIRFYFCIAGENEQAARQNFEAIKTEFLAIIEDLI